MDRTDHSAIAKCDAVTDDRSMPVPDADRVARREKREARRAEQRRVTILRAAKMHAARIAFEREKKPVPKPIEAPRINVGCSGWFYWHWRELFYPASITTKQWFDFYADQFDTVELNAPFYSWPTINTVKTWRRQAGERRFVYAVKANELITHRKRFVGCKTLVRDFGLIADLLGEHFGCFLFQLPPSFHYSAARLRLILDSLDHERRNVVEFRHKSWWNATVFAGFKKSGTIFCSCSGPRLPDDLIATAGEVYVRFHGIAKWYSHDYSDEELTAWVKKIRSARVKRTWAYFNNDRDAHAIRNAKTFARLLKKS